MIKVKEIRLMTKEEWDKYNSLFWSDVKQSPYWLSNKVKSVNGVPVVYVGDWEADEVVIECQDNECWVRPVLIADANGDVPESNNIFIFGRSWDVYEQNGDEIRMVAKNAITRRRFDESETDWEKSELKKWLDAWLVIQTLDFPEKERR